MLKGKILSTMIMVFLLWLSGCTTAPMTTQPGSKPDKADVYSDDGEKGVPSATGVPAADRLLSKGKTYLKEGEYSAAANAFERGLRIAPRSASLYLALARTHMEMADFHSAQQMAQRAVSLMPSSSGDVEQALKIEAWMVISESRESLGDSAGAESARQKAGQYQ